MHKQTFTVTVNKRKKIPLVEGRGYSTVADGQERWSVEVSVDMEALAKVLGPKAVSAAGKKSVEASGLVVVKAIRCEQVITEEQRAARE